VDYGKAVAGVFIPVAESPLGLRADGWFSIAAGWCTTRRGSSTPPRVSRGAPAHTVGQEVEFDLTRGGLINAVSYFVGHMGGRGLQFGESACTSGLTEKYTVCLDVRWESGRRTLGEDCHQISKTMRSQLGRGSRSRCPPV
jgi:hypothetical protein